MSAARSNKIAYTLLLVYAIIAVATITLFKGVGDVGDSVSHYLFARYAPQHHVLYFDHWAKPLFVLLASPFAQFGFAGVKIFNAIVMLLTMLVTYHIALKLQLKNAWVSVLIMMVAPLNYILTFSGLTEPLFALFTALGVYCCLSNKLALACLIISFQPYVRSEGLIIMGVFGLYFLYIKAFKYLPLLLSGSVLYGIAGFFVYHDLLWVFTKIPYATAGSVYGHGPLLHFVEQLVNVVGVPAYALLWIGLLACLVAMLQKRKTPEEAILIVGGFLCFVVAHSLFWYLGIFNSMGLKRVLIGVMPLAAIIILNGFNVVTEQFLKPSPLRSVIMALLIAYLVIFPFTPNPSAINWQKDMMMTPEQKLAYRVADSLVKMKQVAGPMVYNHQYLSLVLNIDHFDEQQRINVNRNNVSALPAGGLVVWESQYTHERADLKKQDLDNDVRLEHVCTLNTLQFGQDIAYDIYRKK